MATYQSIIAYDGTDFHGFQRQAQGIRTVQGVLEDALRTLGWQGQTIRAAGRTDAGVHARGQVIAFDLDWKHEANALKKALNANLPTDVAVWETRRSRGDFHPRFSACGRRYGYTAILTPVRDPLRERFAWRLWPEPDAEDMQRAAERILGRRDFAAFGKAPIPGGHTVREVSHSLWDQEGDILRYEIVADAFLYHMVRRLVAAMVVIGRGRLGINDLEALLEDPELRWEGAIAPARGLCLEEVMYAG